MSLFLFIFILFRGDFCWEKLLFGAPPLKKWKPLTTIVKLSILDVANNFFKKGDSGLSFLLWIMRKFYEHHFYRTPLVVLTENWQENGAEISAKWEILKRKPYYSNLILLRGCTALTDPWMCLQCKRFNKYMENNRCDLG